uniref:Uncharacterized protein n=1 Tax=Kalanchoe fedtschenkoi TaxID=63787 RepID=A0A7N0UVX6_KALFE
MVGDAVVLNGSWIFVVVVQLYFFSGTSGLAWSGSHLGRSKIYGDLLSSHSLRPSCSGQCWNQSRFILYYSATLVFLIAYFSSSNGEYVIMNSEYVSETTVNSKHACDTIVNI